MKSVYTLFACAGLITLSACSDNSGEPESDQNETSMAQTNENLSAQLEAERERTKELEEAEKELREENLELKNDILTYKQESLDRRQEFNEQMESREELHSMALEFFRVMHERDYSQLDELTADGIDIVEDEELLVIHEDKSSRSFHLMQLDQNHFTSRRSLDWDEDKAVSEYSFYRAGEEELTLSGVVEVAFEQRNSDWYVSSIQYVN
ncbi:hypothetical protein [Alkalicoccus halolimnae]|uniref:Lipoprotein n=1 Tax=Alkalicoccus halolimnae TaxID=1667239 RepID=A0AAJ8N1B1_9BACI